MVAARALCATAGAKGYFSLVFGVKALVCARAVTAQVSESSKYSYCCFFTVPSGDVSRRMPAQCYHFYTRGFNAAGTILFRFVRRGRFHRHPESTTAILIVRRTIWDGVRAYKSSTLEIAMTNEDFLVNSVPWDWRREAVEYDG